MLYRYLYVLFVLTACHSYAENNYDKRQIIDFLSGVEKHGFSVESGDWASIYKDASGVNLERVYKKYAVFLDEGRLDKNLFQSGWMIPDKPTVQVEKNLFKKIEKIQSQIPQYKMLLLALKKLKWWQGNAVNIFSDNLVLFEGDESKSVNALNEWLLDIDLLNEDPGGIYSKIHMKILTDIQLKYKLIPDGRLGVSTRQALLAITNQRIKVIKANLERLRWLPKLLPIPHVWVDIPGFKVSWHNGPSKKEYRKAIMGNREKQTPIFKDEIESFSVNPIWKVPHRIAANYLLRHEKKNPGVLREEGFLVYENWKDNAKRVPIDDIKWHKYTQKTFRFRLEQQPGETNRLGQYKFNMPNQYGIYLHDTNKPLLFDKEKRMFSSGCARVEGIESFIERILLSQGIGTSLSALTGLNKKTKIILKKPVPVYLSYFTAWPDENERVRFRDDIYKLDSALVSWF